MISAILQVHKGVAVISLLLSASCFSCAQQIVKNTPLLHSESHVTSNPVEDLQPLSIGDKMPDIEISNIINFPSTTAHVNNFMGKLILIDFWGTTCSNCIKALIKIDSLQNIFKDHLQVLTVTNYDTKEKAIKTLKQYKKTENLALPIVLNDVKLKRLFPHEIVSHVVWIDGNGIVKAITGTEYITVNNIKTVLSGKEIKWPVKNDVFEFDYEKPLLSISQPQTAQPIFTYYSSFSGYIEGIDGKDRITIDSTNRIITRNHFNHTLLQLCDGSLTGGGTGYIEPDKLILKVKDSKRYIIGDQYWAEWQKKNTYTYSVTLPLNITPEKARDFIKKDLTHWLNVLGITVEKKNGVYVITEDGFESASTIKDNAASNLKN